MHTFLYREFRDHFTLHRSPHRNHESVSRPISPRKSQFCWTSGQVRRRMTVIQTQNDKEADTQTYIEGHEPERTIVDERQTEVRPSRQKHAFLYRSYPKTRVSSVAFLLPL